MDDFEGQTACGGKNGGPMDTHTQEHNARHTTNGNNTHSLSLTRTALVDADALEDEPLGVARLAGADLEERVDVQLGWAHRRQVLRHAAAQHLDAFFWVC